MMMINTNKDLFGRTNFITTSAASWSMLVSLALGRTSTVARAFVTSSSAAASGSRAFLVGRRSLAAAFTSTSMVSSSSTAEAKAASTAVVNPFLEQDDLPRFATIEPNYLTPAVETLLEKLERDFQAMEKELAGKENIDYDQVLPEVERMQFPLGYTWGVAGHLNGVKNSDPLREAYEANQPKVVQAMTKFSQSKPLYDALEAIEKKWKEEGKDKDDSFLMQQKRRAVEASLLGMKLGGVGLEGAQKERFNEIKMRLAALATTFSNNVLDTTKDFSLTIEDSTKMEGVPDSAKGLWASSHVQHLKSEAKEGEEVPEMDIEKGPWRITLDVPSYLPAMTHLKDRSLREKVYKAYIQRASEIHGDKNNVPLIYEILTLRREMAEILGYKNYAEVSLAKKMASSVDEVRELTDMVAEKAVPSAKRELAEITEFAKENGGDEYAGMSKLEPWDVTFWSERLKEVKFDMTDEELRPYFALPAVLDGMFSLLSRIFDVEVKAADGEVEVWNKDVRFFKIFDNATGKHIASFFLDPYSRPADKRGGAWMDVCIGKSEAMNRDIPVAYLTCNGSPPVGDQPSLMTFREVETLFHETGHGLQHMLTKATVGDVAGINGVEWDAVELPSQFMENWCYDRPTVYGFAKHWQTGEPLPEDKFQKLCDQKIYNAGMMTTRQLYFGQMDMALHSDFDPVAGEKGEGKTIFDVQREIASQYVPHAMPLEEDRFLCSFSHIFAGGYSAGYYSYLYAEVLSADSFAQFEEVGLDNEEEVKKAGKKFKETVLSLGGGVPPAEVFKQFRGRDPNPEALIRHKGLA